MKNDNMKGYWISFFAEGWTDRNRFYSEVTVKACKHYVSRLSFCMYMDVFFCGTVNKGEQLFLSHFTI